MVGVLIDRARQIRIIFSDANGVNDFDRLGEEIHLTSAVFEPIQTDRRKLFSPKIRREFREWMQSIDIRIAYQLEALVLNKTLTFGELLSIREDVMDMAGSTSAGVEGTADAIRRMGEDIRVLDADMPAFGAPIVLRDMLKRSLEIVIDGRRLPRGSRHSASIMRLTMTPTSMHLDGPFEDQSSCVNVLLVAVHLTFLI